MTQQFQSKTVTGFLLLLASVVGLAVLGKLTPEAVEAIKWVGSTYFGVRGIANFMENLPGNTK